MRGPSFVNPWVMRVKDSSLASIVCMAELSFVAAQVNARVIIYPAEIVLFVGTLYGLLCSTHARCRRPRAGHRMQPCFAPPA
jgi:polar amino acid transport system permease protein